MVAYQYVMVLETRQPLLRVKLNTLILENIQKTVIQHTAWLGALF